jgi:hypothetical protein
MYFSLPGAVVGLALVAGVVMTPFRAFQALTGRLIARSPAPPKQLGLVVMLFLFAFLFWLAVLWAAYNIELAHTCSGDTCIGYMLLALPFPFVYALAEFLLFRARRSSSTPHSPAGKTAA